MTRDEISPEALALIDRFLDELITPEDLKRLEELLRGDVQAQLFFLRYAQLHINLDVEARMQPAFDAFQKRLAADRITPTCGAPATKEALIAAESPSWPVFRSRHRLAVAFGLAAVAILLGSTLLWRTIPRHAETVMTAPQSRPAPVELPLPGVGSIRFDTTETRTIPLSNVGTMMVQGPAQLEFLGPMRARLHHGRIRVLITSERGQGYVVETPNADVTDQGTEFGIDVTRDAATGVVVFRGSVDLTIPADSDPSQVRVERLVQGDGVVVRRTGRMDRLMTIVTSDSGMFAQPGEPRHDGSMPLITDVWDDVGLSDSKKLYEIVPGGLREDVLAYADRPTHEWNGVNASGMPPYLIGADYVKTFNDYKRLQDTKIYVMLSRPARLFVFLDRRVAPPAWLRQDFCETADKIGLDEGPFLFMTHGPKRAKSNLGVGPGQSIDRFFFIWERIVKKPGVVTLGGNAGLSRETGMYGIAAVDLDPAALQSAP